MPQPPKAATTREMVTTLRSVRDDLAQIKVALLARAVDTATPAPIADELGAYVKVIDSAYLDLVEVAYHLIGCAE